MSAVNEGNQTITFDYKNIATGDSFNKLLKNLIKPGIYKIASAITNSGNTISIPAFVAGLNVDIDKFVRVSTTTTVTKEAIEANGDTLVITYSWSDTQENWLDFQWRANGGTPYDNEVILCQVTYTGGVVTAVDNTVQTKGLFIDEDYNMVLDTSLAIGKNSNPSYTLDISGTLNVTGAATLNSTLEVDGAATLNSTLDVTGNLTINDSTSSTNKDTGALIVASGGVGIEENLNIGGIFKVADTTDSSSKDTGCAILEGGLGVEKNAYIGGGLNVASTTDSGSKDSGSIVTEGGIGVEKTLVTGGKVLVKDTTNAVNKDTGSIITEGGIGVELNIYVGGNVTASGYFIGLRRQIGTTFSYTTSNTQTQVYTGISGLISGGPYICHGDVVIAGVNYSLLYVVQVTSSPNYVQLYYYNGTIITSMIFYEGNITNIPYNIGGVI